MTTVSFERSGGVIGNELRFDINLNTIPDDEAIQIMRLIDKSDFFNIPENLAGSTSPDEFQYEVTVDNGGDVHTVRTTDTTMPEDLRPLVRELTMMKILRR